MIEGVQSPQKRRVYAVFGNFLPFSNDHEKKRKTSKILEKLCLAGPVGSIMYAKFRAKNWATLFEIDPSKELKIKSVAQFMFSTSCRTVASCGWLLRT